MVISNSINNTVGATNSGATNTLTVTNPSNTASSQSLVNVTVGGTSAGDAFTTYTVAGTTNWSHGIDNSVTGDPYVLAASTALGTTNVMSAATAGQVNWPLQPVFTVRLNNSAANVTGAGTAYTVVFDTETFDIGNNFNNTTGVFTAPVTGKYFFSSSVRITGLTAGMTSATIAFSTSNRGYTTTCGNVGAMRSVTDTLSVTVTTMADMDVNDTMSVIVTVSGATDVAGIGGSSAIVTWVTGALTT